MLLMTGIAAVGVGLMAFNQPEEPLRVIDNDSFTTGEKLHYKVHYGFINAAESVIEIDNKTHMVNDRPCYRVNVFGKTIGSFDFFLRIRDTWRSYIDTEAIVSQRFFRNIEEGKYRKKETVTFDHNRLLALQEDDKQFKIPKNVQDLVSGFYYMRTLDYSKMKTGEPIKITGFFDEETFVFDVTFKGRETIKTKFGELRVLRLVPKMPKNKLFDGDDAVSVYLSDDQNKIPVKIKAEMFVGAVEIDLTKYQGLKHPINFTK